ncbi:MAG: hypothetical protein FH758_13590 [Firmicutes bacterium]|nr:hypothetical protein [Bacillota bacterium]
MKKAFITLLLVSIMILAVVIPGYAQQPSGNWLQVGEISNYYNYTDALTTVNGDVYQGIRYNGVSFWDGSKWSEMGNLKEDVRSLTTVNDVVYAGTFNSVWSWNNSNSTWSMVGNLKDHIGYGLINSLTTVNGAVYAGSRYAGVWAWDGSDWSRVEDSPSANTLTTVNGAVYAGTENDGVWNWDGSRWSIMDGLVGDAATVYSLSLINGKLYAGTMDGVWSWDGSNWSRVGNLPDNVKAVSLTAVNDKLYAAILTYSAGGDGVWSWDGSSWSKVGNLIGDAADIFNLTTANGILYAGPESNGVWSWDGSDWSKVDKEGILPDRIHGSHSLTIFNNTVYAGTINDGVWFWDDTTSKWSEVGNLKGKTSNILSLKPFSGQLYAGTYDGVWSWNDSDWSKIGSLKDDAASVLSFTMLNDKLYAATKDGVWYWDDSNSKWFEVGSLAGDSSYVTSLATVNGKLYAGTWGAGVWYWDETDSNWLEASGLADYQAYVYSLTLFDGRLYAGTYDGVWFWNKSDSKWSEASDLETGASYVRVRSLTTDNGKLYAGTFDGVWSWNNLGWSKVDGLEGNAEHIRSLTMDNGKLYAASYSEGVWGIELGQALLNTDILNPLNLGGYVQSESGGQITIDGQIQKLAAYTSGDLNNVDLTTTQTVGDQAIQVKKAVRLKSDTGQPITITNADNNVSVSIPDGTSILAPTNWDGIINPPGVVENTGTAPSGFTVGDTEIEVGSSNAVFLFDKPVVLTLKGVTRPVGYKPAGSDNWVQITEKAGGTYDNPTAPAFPGEAYISNVTDTKIITWHLASFATLKDENKPATDGSSSGGGSRDRGTPSTSDNDSGTVNIGIGETVTNLIEENGHTVETITVSKSAASLIKEEARSNGANVVKISAVGSERADATVLNIPRSVLKSASNMGIRIEGDGALLGLSSALTESLPEDDLSITFSSADVERVRGNMKGTPGLSRAEVVGAPAEINTGIRGSTRVTIPLREIKIPSDAEGKQEFLSRLAVFVLHDDGEKEVLKGKISYDQSGNPIGITVTVDRFSTFAVVKNVESDITVMLTLGQTSAFVGGEPYTLDSKPFINDSNRTMVPVRFVTEALGAQVNWEQKTKKVTVVDGNTEVVLSLADSSVLVNGEAQFLDAPALISGNRTFVPLRFVSETLGALVEYDSQEKQITITR